MLDVCKWLNYLLQAKLDVDSMKFFPPKLAVASVTILLLWSDMYVVGKLDDSNIDKENGITSVWEDIKSYWAVWEPCRLIRCGV